MSLLLESAPLSVEITGTEYALDADFRNAIRFELLMLDNDVPEETRGLLALRLFFPVIPADIEAAFERILWFYSCGEEQRRTKSAGQGGGKRIYSFEHDGAHIYAAFLADYGIDLESVEFLHWWKFRALFEALRDDNLICKIMGYRAADIKKLKGEQRKHYLEMKRLYAIPLPRGEREKLDEISAALMGNGNLSEALSKNS